MDTKVAATAATSDPLFSQSQPSVAPAKAADAKPAPVGPDPMDLRLVIEEDQASGSYVYKTVDRRTGEIIMQLPRAEVLRMRSEVLYQAGRVISTKA